MVYLINLPTLANRVKALKEWRRIVPDEGARWGGEVPGAVEGLWDSWGTVKGTEWGSLEREGMAVTPHFIHGD